MTILVLNAGSSTLKFAAYEHENDLTLRFKDQVQGAGAPALAALLARLEREDIDVTGLSGIGHRIVHGGTEFSAPVVVDDAIEARLNALRPLAPLHQPYGLDALRLMRERRQGSHKSPVSTPPSIGPSPRSPSDSRCPNPISSAVTGAMAFTGSITNMLSTAFQLRRARLCPAACSLPISAMGQVSVP
jgi:hypothetical protein